MDERRSKGLAKMNEVYGWEMPNIEGDAYFDLTVDHLFGSIAQIVVDEPTKQHGVSLPPRAIAQPFCADRLSAIDAAGR